jgi:hypothetical protein
MTDHADLIARTKKRLEDHPTSWLPSDLPVMRRLIAALEGDDFPHGHPEIDADALEYQPAPLVADSREAIMAVLNAEEHTPMEYHHQDTGECVQCPWPVHALGAVSIADALLASGVVSLAADRDRAVAHKARRDLIDVIDDGLQYFGGQEFVSTALLESAAVALDRAESSKRR